MDADPAPDAGTLPSPGHVLVEPEVPAEPLPPVRRRLRAMAEVLACSGYPTQVVGQLLVWALSGGQIGGGRPLTLGVLFGLIAIDSVAIIGLVCFFLRAGGERPAETLLGHRHPVREAAVGLWLLPLLFGIVGTAVLFIARFAPWLRQEDNPFAALVNSPVDAVVLAAIGIVGGGIREEVQRAFILHRFEQHLGGARVGLLVFSVVFGLLHALQGWAAAIITGLLGAFWGLVYLWRRSIVAPVVSHASFNLVETLFFLNR